jgi:hypothetical protein
MKALLEKIAIFALLTIAVVCVVAGVLPILPMDSETFSATANAEPFIGQ